MATRKHKRKRNAPRSAVRKPRRRRPVRAAAAHTKHRVRKNPSRYNPVSRRKAHRKHRRNPGMSGGVVKMLVQGLKDGAVVAVGRGVTKLVAGKIPFGQTSAIGKGAMQLLVGVLSAMAVKKISKSDRMTAFYLAGATSGVISALAADVPVIGPMLGDGGLGRSGGGVHAWAALPQMGAWAAMPVGAPRPSNSALGGINTGWIGGDAYSDGIMS